MATGVIVDVNKTACKMFERSYEEALRLTLHDIGTGEPPYSEIDAARWIKRVADEGPQVFEWQCRRPSGELFWMEVSL